MVRLAGLLGRHVDGCVGGELGDKVSVTTKPARRILMPVAGSECCGRLSQVKRESIVSVGQSVAEREERQMVLTKCQEGEEVRE